jgi:mannose-1-phosphate guanylyltransferase / mannose-6-phosphate isomerase
MKFNLYTISKNSTIKDALKKIDINNKKFIIVQHDNRVSGVLTDGDIRRLILSGKELSDKITYYKDYYFVDYKASFSDVCQIFKNNSIDFLPILKDRKLFNIITKHQFHAMLLEDAVYNSNMDFSAFDDVTIEYEIHNRPWGFYKCVWLSSSAQAKIITLFPQSEISLQKHSMREEHWIVVKGQGRVINGNEDYIVSSGEYVRIPKGCKHKVTNNSSCNNLILSEVQLGTYFGEDDIIRYGDKYGRV